MALANYTDLLAAVATWLRRTDQTSSIPDFVVLAEERIARDLAEIAPLWTRSASTTVTTSANSFALPADANGLRSVRLTTDYYEDLPIRPIEEILAYSGNTITGRPQKVAIAGSSSGALQAYIYPWANKTYTFEILYPAALALASTTTNVVMTKSPSIYLFGTLVEAAISTWDDERLAIWEPRYQQAIDAFKTRKWGGDMSYQTDFPFGDGGGYDITSG
jgi:hypothetical protein